MTVVLQQGINGIVVGSLYVLVALGLTLVYGVLVQINFAHADIVTLGAFSAYFFTHGLGGNYLASIAAAFAVGAALGLIVNAAIFAPLRERGNELLPLIATIGASILLENAMLAALGPVPYAFETPYSNQVLRIGGIGNVEGTIMAGLGVGLIESYTTQFLGPGLIDIVVFALLLATLAVRPTGLIAERREENV